MFDARYAQTASRDMDLDWLRDFLALVEHRTFSRAADARNVTQPAFSRRIRSLEDWVGTPLFDRSSQGASPTPAGRHFVLPAQHLLRDLERSQRETRAIGQRETAGLSIAATHALSFTFFPGWIRNVLQPQALGTLNLISDSMAACEQLMLTGQVHFLLCHFHAAAGMRFPAESFPSVWVGEDVLVPFSAVDAAGQARWTLPGTPTAPTPYLAYGQASGLGRIVTACQGSLLADLTPSLTSHLAATLAPMVRAGHGVAWLPQTLVADDQAHGRLVRAGSARFDIPVEVRLFRCLRTRNKSADRLWDTVSSRTGLE
jgi:LysR family transcriptional regulator, hypochlorite-specific transcription factor HypT